MTLRTKEFSNDEGLKDTSLLDDYEPVKLWQQAKNIEDGQLFQAVEIFVEGRRGVKLVRVG